MHIFTLSMATPVSSKCRLISDIDFETPKAKRQRQIEEGTSKKKASSTSSKPLKEPTDEELKDFYKNLAQCGKSKAAILSIVPGFSEKFVCNAKGPSDLSCLLDESMLTVPYPQLLSR